MDFVYFLGPEPPTEPCVLWPGQALTAWWRLRDPADGACLVAPLRGPGRSTPPTRPCAAAWRPSPPCRPRGSTGWRGGSGARAWPVRWAMGRSGPATCPEPVARFEPRRRHRARVGRPGPGSAPIRRGATPAGLSRRGAHIAGHDGSGSSRLTALALAALLASTGGGAGPAQGRHHLHRDRGHGARGGGRTPRRSSRSPARAPKSTPTRRRPATSSRRRTPTSSSRTGSGSSSGSSGSCATSATCPPPWSRRGSSPSTSPARRLRRPAQPARVDVAGGRAHLRRQHRPRAGRAGSEERRGVSGQRGKPTRRRSRPPWAPSATPWRRCPRGGAGSSPPRGRSATSRGTSASGRPSSGPSTPTSRAPPARSAT